ncbi:MAG: FAD-dependent tricarballylate dehydrogenase TcuA, partial [Deltaproteobacteria bacterium]|nr:FAD-dependent tricarballylate dehydrogenase TcuA [Deltaproteobacteria bacterium]
METKVYDVIVVGAGNAALSAALSASEAGASVLILEKAPKSARGGSARFTSGGKYAYGDMKDIRALIPDLTDEEAERLDMGRYSVDDYYGDLMRISQGRADPELSMILAQESYPSAKWLVDMGVKYEVHYNRLSLEKDGKRHCNPRISMPYSVKGGMGGLNNQFFGIIEGRPGMEVRYETKAVKLLVDGTGRVCGVGVKDATGFHDVQARAVVLASGGFQASPEMRVKYLGPEWDMVKVRGSRYDTGEGLEMALDLLDLGAAVSGQFSGCHANQVFLSGPDVDMEDESFAHEYHFGILVNVLGKRFVDEAADYRRYTYARLGQEVRVQPQAIAFQIFDAKVTHLLGDPYQKARGVTARSLEELADELDIDDKRCFLATIQEFNSAVQEGEFNPRILDGKRTEGIEPAKSNWALRIDTPPFLCYPVTC